jgi:capsular exopolysaccharide synthesis family protein
MAPRPDSDPLALTFAHGGAPEIDPSGAGRAATAFDWRQAVTVLRRRAWPALTIFVIALTAGAVHGFTRVPVYQARTRLLIDRDRSDAITGLKDPLEQDPASDSDFQTQLSIFQSRSLARRTLEALGAWQTTPAVSESAQIDRFLAGLKIAPLANSRLVDLYYVGGDPAATARYANTLAEQFIAQMGEYRSLVTRDVTDWLSDRLAEQKKALEASDRALQQYVERTGVVAAKQQATLVVQKLADLSSAYTKAKTDRIEQEARFTQIEALRRDRAPLEAFAPLVTSAPLQQLRSEVIALQNQQAQLAQSLGDRHPTLVKAREAVQAAQARLQAETQRAIESARGEYLAARDAETKLGDALEAQKRESLSLNRSDVELAVLQRDEESNRQIYDNLLQRLNELAVTRERRGNNIRVVDAAEIPQQPIGAGAYSDIRYGALAGLVLGLALAFGLEVVDNRIKTPQQIEDLGLPLIGLVPRVDGDAGSPLLGRATPAVFNEAFRAVRTNVRLSIASDRMRTLLVTSARAGDGKTLVASNVAVALALADQRVMLIDADLRRPRLHEVFHVPQQKGLTDLLVGQATAADTIRRTDAPNLHLLPAGTTSPNPSELLDSTRFAEFLAHLEKYFDWVVLDSPPLMPVTDALVIANKVNGVLLVATAEATPLPALRTALDQLRRSRVPVLGTVLNQVDLKRRAYYYTEYYHREYDAYYVRSAD